MSKTGESPQPAGYNESAGRQVEDEGLIEDRRIGGWEMGLQSGIIFEDHSLSNLNLLCL